MSNSAPPIPPAADSGGPDPLRRAAEWVETALASDLLEPTAFALSTVGPDGHPSSRMVLLKGLDAQGFAFYTNLESRKVREMETNPWVALCFFWAPLGRQLRVEGRVEPVSATEADGYYASRARGSRIGAWASRQSAPLGSREELEERVRQIEARHPGEEIPRPPFWSGFRVLPAKIEFWQAMPNRLHDRELYTRDPENPEKWRVQRLYP